MALLKGKGMRPGKGGNHMADLPILEQRREFAVTRAAIVANGGDIFDAAADQGLNQIIGEARTAESAKHNTRAVGNALHGGVGMSINFAFHGQSPETVIIHTIVSNGREATAKLGWNMGSRKDG